MTTENAPKDLSPSTRFNNQFVIQTVSHGNVLYSTKRSITMEKGYFQEQQNHWLDKIVTKSMN